MKERNILKSKTYLYLTEFFAGMSVMAVELSASRLLAPYFSSSQIVWTIIIATIMIAMAAGNVYGGRSSDKNPDPDRLYRRLLIAAVWIAGIPLLGRYVIVLISGILIVTVSHHLLVIASFIACLTLFAFPCFLLGTVTPSLVKYTVDSLDDSGSTVGLLGAFNTIGSILGTFLPTFVTIPAAGTAATFLIFSGVLLILALVYFISRRRKKTACLLCALLFALSCIFGSSGSFAFWEEDLTYEGESVYNYLQVKETDREVFLSTNVLFGVQSVLEKEDALTGMYYDYAMAAPVMAAANRRAEAAPNPLRILVLGMGCGTYDHQCRATFSALEIEGVEIDGKITALAHRYFSLPEDAHVTTYDGRAYLMATDQRYDVIFVDAYQDITIPFQMSSREFFLSVRDHLSENGILTVNMNMRSETPDGINSFLSDTISAVFPWVSTMDVPASTNRILFAAMQKPDPDAYEQALEQVLTPEPARRAQALSFLSGIPARLTDYEAGGKVLTDDQAPVELLGMQAIDQIITDELAFYRRLYQQQGLHGLLNTLL